MLASERFSASSSTAKASATRRECSGNSRSTISRPSGVSTTLAAELDPARIGTALRALQGRALVLCGRNAPLDSLGRLVYAARQVGGELTVFDFRGALPDTGASTVTRLAAAPLRACDTLLGELDGTAPRRRPVAVPRRAPAAVGTLRRHAS